MHEHHERVHAQGPTSAAFDPAYNPGHYNPTPRKSNPMSKPHDPEFLTKNNVFNRLAVASVWPYPRAPHVRDRRRLRILESANVSHEED